MHVIYMILHIAEKHTSDMKTCSQVTSQAGADNILR